MDCLTRLRSNSPRWGILGKVSWGYLLWKFSYKFSSTGLPWRFTNYYLSSKFILETLAAWHQKESCTAAKVMPSFLHYIELNIIWVESKEWTKLGGKAVFCFCLLTGWSSRLSTTVTLYRIVDTIFFWLIYLYGWTQGKPIGVIHLTGSPVPATTLAHLANHSLILLASLNKSPIHLIVRRAKYWAAL